MEIVLSEINLGVVEPDVGIVGKRKPDAVVQSKHQLSTGNMIQQALKCRERRCRLLVAADSQEPLQPRCVLRAY